MANHKSSEKRARQTRVKTERNRFYKTRIKNVTKNVLAAIEIADKEKAIETMKTANNIVEGSEEIINVKNNKCNFNKINKDYKK